MALYSSRDRHVADEGRSLTTVIVFEKRDAATATSMLLKHADYEPGCGCELSFKNDKKQVVHRILEMCDGLPIANSIAGVWGREICAALEEQDGEAFEREDGWIIHSEQLEYHSRELVGRCKGSVPWFSHEHCAKISEST